MFKRLLKNLLSVIISLGTVLLICTCSQAAPKGKESAQKRPMASGLGEFGKLPAPMPMPRGSVEEAAAALAKEVVSGGETALPALLTAVQASGLSIVHEGVVTFSPVWGSQGLAFQAWEVQSMAKLERDGLRAPLRDIGRNIGSLFAELKDAPVDQLIIDGIRASAASKNKPLRFWAMFILELGRNSVEPYDLLSGQKKSDVHLDSVQLQFVLLRLQGDLSGALDLNGPSSKRFPQVAGLSFIPEQPVPGNEFSAESFAIARAKIQQGCALNDISQKILDVNAAVVTKGFELLVDYVDLKWLTKAGKAIQVFNTLSTYANLVLTMALFDLEIGMDEGAPLKRTTDTKAGEKKHLYTKVMVKLDTKEAQNWLNCFRPMLNTVGIDFALPQGGVLENVKVEWSFLEGGPRPARGEKGMVRFYGDLSNNFTNKEGLARIGIEGVPQMIKLKNPSPVRKKAKVRAGYKIQPANMFRDITAAVDGWQTLPAELLTRTDWAFGGTYSFDVIDWDVFVLKYEASLKETTDITSMYAEVSSFVRLEVNANGELRGSAPVEIKSYRRSIDLPCPVTITPPGDGEYMTEVYSLKLKKDVDGFIRDAELEFSPIEKNVKKTPRESLHVRCPDIPLNFFADNDEWLYIMAANIYYPMIRGKNGIIVADWESVDEARGEIILRKKFKKVRNEEIGVLETDVTLEIWSLKETMGADNY